jgi:uncharacterized caspase-like protein
MKRKYDDINEISNAFVWIFLLNPLKLYKKYMEQTMIKKGMAFLVICIMVVLSFAQEGSKGVRIKLIKGNAGKRLAICIGINDYEDKTIIDLNKAQNDAKELGKVLKEYGQFDHVYVMTDDLDPKGEEYPKLMNIRRILDFLKEFIDPEDLVVFSFSGHGVANSDGKGFLVMADSYVGDLFGSSLKVEEIVTWLKEMKVKKSLLLLDACREQFQEGKAVNLNGLKAERFLQAEVGAVLYSTKSGWFSYEEEKEGNFGIFTKYVIEGLKGRADSPKAEGNGDGIVTFSELGAYVEEAVSNWALKKERRQKPYTKINGEKFGDLALSTYTASKSDTVLRETFTLRADRVAKNGDAVKLAFKFPSRINYKMFKNGIYVGRCQLLYNEKTSKKGISSLKLKDFQGLGITSNESLISYIFSDNLSLYASFLTRGTKVFSEVRLREIMGFDGQERKDFVFKDRYSDDEIQRELFNDLSFKSTDLLSALLVASQRVASEKYKSNEKFNLIFDKRIRLVDMFYLGREKIPFREKKVSSEVLAIVYNNVELFRLNIFIDNDGYCFPVKISFIDFKSW